MVVLDATIVNIALPSMAKYFDRSQTDMTWAINAYTLAFGGLLLLGGRAGDILGRRQMFSSSVSGCSRWAACSAGCRCRSRCCWSGESFRASAAPSRHRPRCR